jgi:hypothetical protein
MRVIELKNQIKALEDDLDLEYQKWLGPVKAFVKATNIYPTSFDNVIRITNIEVYTNGFKVTGTSYTWRGYDYYSMVVPTNFFDMPDLFIEVALAARETKRLALEEAKRELKLLAELKAKYE